MKIITRTFFTVLICAFLSVCGSPYGIYHTVQKGQTLYRISKAYNVPVEKLMEINNIEDPSSLKVGDRIFIPGADKELYVEPYSELEVKENQKIVKQEPERKTYIPKKYEDKDIPHFSGFIWPVEGKVFRGFENSNSQRHDGIDISVPEGTPIKAASGGRVIYSGSGIKGYGNIIIIKHANNYFTVYAHNKENHVLEGDMVRQGQIIGKVGQTGRASGPHLHFEIRKGKTPVDPLKLLR